jgi:hypothetical protein
MKLLRNQAEFEEWKEFNIFDGDEAGQPREFPCYVRLRVKDWHMEYEEAVYLYRSDIEKMLSDMDAEPPISRRQPIRGTAQTGGSMPRE